MSISVVLDGILWSWFCFYTFFVLSKCFATNRFYLHNHNIASNHATEMSRLLTGRGMVVLYGYRQSHWGGQATVPWTTPFHWPFGVFLNFSRIIMQEPHVKQLPPLWGILPNWFPKRMLPSPLPPAACENACPAALRPDGQLRPWTASLSARRAGKGFVWDARMVTPDPEPQEWVLTSPVPRTGTCREREKQASRKKTLCWKTHTHRLK